jgi:hypothetical protein
MACGTAVGRVFTNGLCATVKTNYKYNQDVPSTNVVALFLAKFIPVV